MSPVEETKEQKLPKIISSNGVAINDLNHPINIPKTQQNDISKLPKIPEVREAQSTNLSQNVNINITTGNLSNGSNINVITGYPMQMQSQSPQKLPFHAENTTITSYDELFELFGLKKESDEGGYVQVIHPESGAIIKIPKKLINNKDSISEQKKDSDNLLVEVWWFRLTLFFRREKNLPNRSINKLIIL